VIYVHILYELGTSRDLLLELFTSRYSLNINRFKMDFSYQRRRMLIFLYF